MSRRSFQTGLYQEHCEEIAGLYELRRARMDDWEATRAGLAAIEARVEAHVDALVLGEDEALAVVDDQSVPADLACLYTRLTLACRAARFERISPCLDALADLCGGPDVTPEDAALACRAAADALCHHAPPAWSEPLIDALAAASPLVAPVLAVFASHRRVDRGAAAVAAMAGRDVDLVTVLRAVARLPGADVGLLHANLDHEDPRVAREAALGALRRDPRPALAALTRRWPAPWTAIPLALCAGPGLSEQLRAAASREPTSERVLALGLLGDSAAIDVLLAHLRVDGVAAAAALALYLISGAPLRGPVVATDAADWLSWSGHDISVDPEQWTRWLATRRAGWTPGVRHRFGAPASAIGDLAALERVELPRGLRRLLGEELVIRHGLDPGFEPDMLLATQAQQLAAARPRAQAQRSQPGAWTRHGRTVTGP